MFLFQVLHKTENIAGMLMGQKRRKAERKVRKWNGRHEKMSTLDNERLHNSNQIKMFTGKQCTKVC